MLMKIGELAKRTGLTVRALRHYDELGLLSPSARSEAGYRLYNRNDVARLHQVLALRQLGLPLADIGASLTRTGSALASLIERQMHALDEQITEAVALRNRLGRLHDVLRQGEQPELVDWLTTLELMTMYDKYFSADEQSDLNSRKHDPYVTQAQMQWPALIAEVKELMASGVAVTEARAQAAADRWTTLVNLFTGGNPNLAIKSAQMLRNESSVQTQTGIDPDMMNYVSGAIFAGRLALYANYLDEAEMARMRAHYGKHPEEWIPLIAEVRNLMKTDGRADTPQAKALGLRWEALTSRFAGEDPLTRQKMLNALRSEPTRLMRTGIDNDLLEFVRATGVNAVC